jgi:type IV pilus assembly protein PilP
MRAFRWVPVVVVPLMGCAPERVDPPYTVGAQAPVASVAQATSLGAVPAAPRLALDDAAIAEGQASRDPFRAFAPSRPEPPPDHRPRKSKRWAVEQLKLVALVTRTDTPRAMVVDPSGKGWVLTRGDLLGRPEVVRAAGDPHTASWRVDRIREADVVLVREGDGTSGTPAATRVLALHPEPPPNLEDD